MTIPSLTIRTVDFQTDLPDLAQLYTSIRPEIVTEEQIRDWWQAKPDEIRLTRVALNEQGRIVGMSDVQRENWMRPDHFWVQVIVDQEWRSRGIGSLLFDSALRFAQSRDACALESVVRDNDSRSLHFAEGRGYQIERHSFDSALDLASFDEAKFSDELERVKSAGFCFFSLAEAGPLSEELKRKLYELNRITALDNPGNHRTFPGYETFSKNVFDASWFRADTQLLAAHGDHWVGLSAIAFYPEDNHAFNAFTGVLPEYRGRGLATVLKLHALRLAQKLGARYIRTNNDSQNVPMLAVNHKLGYKPEPGSYQLICKLGDKNT